MHCQYVLDLLSSRLAFSEKKTTTEPDDEKTAYENFVLFPSLIAALCLPLTVNTNPVGFALQITWVGDCLGSSRFTKHGELD